MVCKTSLSSTQGKSNFRTIYTNSYFVQDMSLYTIIPEHYNTLTCGLWDGVVYVGLLRHLWNYLLL